MNPAPRFAMGSADGLPPSRLTAYEMVREQLRRLILSGSFTGGTRLVQSEIAAQLNVSITPVREALRDLAADGLIQLDVHRGATIRPLSREDFCEIYLLRQLLEPTAMRRAAVRGDDELLARARHLQEGMDTVRDVGTWADLNRRFHEVLVEGADLPRLRGMLKSLRDSSAPYVAFALRNVLIDIEAANSEHHEFLAAFEKRDGTTAAAVTERHLETTAQALRETATFY